MLVLGVTTKDKGTQLEALVHTELTSQGYAQVHTNVVGAGGNELDVTGVREIDVVGSTHPIPLLCEAKAYADPVSMPTWQKFLGKLFIARAENPGTLGMLVALSGVNGNVRGSFLSLRERDNRIFVVDGNLLLKNATRNGQVSSEVDVRSTIETRLQRRVSALEAAYYGSAYYWLAWWNEDEYSVSDAHGQPLSARRLADLEAPLAGAVSGTLLGAENIRKQAEARHELKLNLIDRLFHGSVVSLGDCPTDDEGAAFTSLAEEPYCRVEGQEVALIAADDLDAVAVRRLFISLFEHAVPVHALGFMAEHLHDSYVQRLIDALPEIQRGFTVDPPDEATLREVAPVFPSVWGVLAQPIEMITTHRSVDEELNDAILSTDRNTFWEEITRAVRADFTNSALRGFLYDHMGVAELEETALVTVKAKRGALGTMRSENRTAVRQLADGLVGEDGARHALVRMVPTVAQPWDEQHPEPIPLRRELAEAD